MRHSIWSVLDAALYPAVYLATVPLLMHSLGQEAFGFWIVLTSLITILQLFNFNLGTTAIRNISFELAAGNREKVVDVINGILNITLILFAIAASAGLILAFIAQYKGLWGLDNSYINQLFSCIILAALFAGLKYFDQVFQSIIKAYEKFRLAALLNMLNRFGLLSINLALAIGGYSILQMLWANIIFSLAYLAIQFICIRRFIPFYAVGRVKDRTQYKELLSFSIWPWLQSLIVVLAFQTDRFWVSGTSGLSEVSAYGLVATMFNHVHMIFTAMAAWMLPRISAMASRGDDPAGLYRTVRSGLFGIILFSLLLFYFLSPIIFPIWVGEETYGQLYRYIRAFVAFEIVFAHSIMPFFYFNAAGKERLGTLLTLFYCGTSYLCMLGGLWLFHSPVAMVEGMTLAMCISMPVINVIAQRKLSGGHSWEGLLEMAPMYAAIALLYAENIWIVVGLVLFVAWLLWKFYLTHLIDKGLWKQAIRM